ALRDVLANGLQERLARRYSGVKLGLGATQGGLQEGAVNLIGGSGRGDPGHFVFDEPDLIVQNRGGVLRDMVGVLEEVGLRQLPLQGVALRAPFMRTHANWRVLDRESVVHLLNDVQIGGVEIESAVDPGNLSRPELPLAHSSRLAGQISDSIS